MKISQAGIDLIKKWETLKLDMYVDAAGVKTIGYGHTRTTQFIDYPVTEYEANQLLRIDLLAIESQLERYLLDIKLRQCQYDAIVSFCFNMGVGSFINSDGYKAIKKDPDSKYIADSFITYRNAAGKYLRGLMRRRLDELSLYYSW